MTSRLDRSISTEELMLMDYRYHYSNEELIDDWDRLCNITTFKTGSQFKPGLKLCQHFFPNFWNIQNEKGLSFADCWKNPIIMDKVRRWGLEGMSQLWLSWIRRAVFMSAGLPNSSMYRPHFAKQIIMMTNKKNGVLFDPCAGWGGRLLGTVAAGWHYVGCEPNIETYENIRRMIEFLGIQKRVQIHNTPAESFSMTSLRNIDIVLTSPPYFNLEVYSDDETQSYVKHSTYQTWRDNWLYPLITAGLSIVTNVSAWNVMNFKKYNLVDDVIDIHKQNGWSLTTTVGFQSPLANIRALKNKDVTYVFERT